MQRFHIIDAEELQNMAKTGEYIIVDLRMPREYQKQHIETAISLPMATIEDIENMSLKNKKWILYCNRGSLSFKLASKMAERGYDVTAVRGKIFF